MPVEARASLGRLLTFSEQKCAPKASQVKRMPLPRSNENMVSCAGNIQ